MYEFVISECYCFTVLLCKVLDLYQKWKYLQAPAMYFDYE